MRGAAISNYSPGTLMSIRCCRRVLSLYLPVKKAASSQSTPKSDPPASPAGLARGGVLTYQLLFPVPITLYLLYRLRGSFVATYKVTLHDLRKTTAYLVSTSLETVSLESNVLPERVV